MVEAIRIKDVVDRLERVERGFWYQQKLLDELGKGNPGEVLVPDSTELFKFKWGDLVFGGISRIENTVETAIGVAGTPVQIEIFDTNQPSNGLTPDQTNNHVTIDIAGTYLIIISTTIISVAGAASVLELEAFKNNGATVLNPIHADRNVSGGGGDVASTGLSGFATLAVNDTVEVWITNETNTQNYIVEDITLNLLLVGG